MSIEDIIKKYEEIALSDKEVLKLVNSRANLILYPDLHKYRTIDELLGKYKACIILYVSRMDPDIYGHWCCIFKVKPNTLEFFNSYGEIPDVNLEDLPMEKRIKMNEDYPYLAMLMYNSPYKLTFNEHQFQDDGSDIKTCGRHTALRLACRWMSLKKYYNMFKKLTKKLRMTNDELCTFLTMYINK